jgi:triacylglycerol lipase
MKRCITSAAIVVALVLVSACQTIRPTGTPSGRTPVVFVHGWSANSSTWDAAVDQFVAAGYTSGDITVLSYDTSLPASQAAAVLATEVDHLRSYTGEAQVNIVSHSFGSMVARYCIELGACDGKVDRWMSLAGADNGTSIANLCALFQPSCQDMAGQTPTIAQLQAAWPEISAQAVEVEVQWTSNDGVIIPATASQNPAPAVNVQVSSTLGHNDLPSNPGIIDETIDFFDT